MKRIPIPLAVSGIVVVLYFCLLGIQASRYDELTAQPTLTLGPDFADLSIKETGRTFLTRTVEIGIAGEEPIISTKVIFGVFPKIKSTLILDALDLQEKPLIEKLSPVLTVQLSPNLNISRIGITTNELSSDTVNELKTTNPELTNWNYLGAFHINLDFKRTVYQLDYSIDKYDIEGTKSEGHMATVFLDVDNPDIISSSGKSGKTTVTYPTGQVISFDEYSFDGKSQFIENKGVYSANIGFTNLMFPSVYSKPISATSNIHAEWPKDVSPTIAALSLLVSDEVIKSTWPKLAHTDITNNAFRKFLAALIDGKIAFVVDNFEIASNDFNIHAKAKFKYDALSETAGTAHVEYKKLGSEIPTAIAKELGSAESVKADFLFDTDFNITEQNIEIIE